MQLVEQHIIKPKHSFYNECKRVCFLSKNLYNSALYFIRQKYFNSKEYVNYYSVNKEFIKNKQLDYISLPRKVSNQTLMLVDKNFKSFFALLKKKKTKDYDKKINIPKYLKKDGLYATIYEKGSISFKTKGVIKLSKTNINIPTNKTNINQVRIIPKNNYFVIEVVYTVLKKEVKEDNKRYCAIDLGLNNLATISSNIQNIKPIIINGKPIKSINQYYNKKKTKIQSELKKINKKDWSNKLSKLTLKRNNKIKDYLHKASLYIVNHLVSNSINTLVIGYNKEWKQDINIGKKNNQNFVNIPFYIFINLIKYKCELEGIVVIIREESYTSKCSFLDNEEVKKQEFYLGKRIKRGLFKSSTNKLINSDLNGSLNILKKAFSNCFEQDGIEGFAVNPIIIFL